MERNKIFFITPTNESQDLNYIETKCCSLTFAKTRAIEIVRELEKLFPRGSWACKIENQDCTKEWYYGYDKKFTVTSTKIYSPAKS